MFLLDANAFMEAGRLYYGFDIAPGFWKWLAGQGRAGRAGSIRAVRDEITAGTGTLVDWAGTLPSTFWREDTQEVVSAMSGLAAWAIDPARLFRPAAVDAFMRSADLRLIAHAMTSGDVIVTRERSEPESRKKVKIPDACIAFGVSCQDPFQTYRDLGLRLT